jgi:hypothetical protein
MIGNITAGQTGQFAVTLQWPGGVTPPAGYNPAFTASSPDPLITLTPASVDDTNGAVPLAQQDVATVAANDANTSGAVSFSCIGTDGVTVLTSNAVSFIITQPAPPPPAEPTLVATQVG